MTTHAFPIYTVFASEIPAVQPGQAVMLTHEYLAALDPVRRQPVWVAYHVEFADHQTDNVLARNFSTPRQFRGMSLESSDYDGAGWADRGHCVGLAHKAASRHANECNWMPVISIQSSDANQGPILRIEERIRHLTQKHEVEVIYANLFEGCPHKLPNADEEHEAPSHYCYLIRCAGEEEAYIVPWDCKRDEPRELFTVTPQEMKDRVSETWWSSE